MAASVRVCASCGSEVPRGETAVLALDGLFHEACFTCRACAIPCKDISFMKHASGHPVCVECYRAGADGSGAETPGETGALDSGTRGGDEETPSEVDRHCSEFSDGLRELMQCVQAMDKDGLRFAIAGVLQAVKDMRAAMAERFTMNFSDTQVASANLVESAKAVLSAGEWEDCAGHFRDLASEAINLAAAIRYIINEYNNLVGGDGSGDAGLGGEPGGTGTGAMGAAGGGSGGGDAPHRSPQTPITISVSDETHVAEELPPMVAFLGAFYKNAQNLASYVQGSVDGSKTGQHLTTLVRSLQAIMNEQGGSTATWETASNLAASLISMVRDGDYDKLVFIQAVKELTDNVKSIVDDEDDESDARVVQNAFSLGLEEFGVGVAATVESDEEARARRKSRKSGFGADWEGDDAGPSSSGGSSRRKRVSSMFGSWTLVVPPAAGGAGGSGGNRRSRTALSFVEHKAQPMAVKRRSMGQLETTVLAQPDATEEEILDAAAAEEAAAVAAGGSGRASTASPVPSDGGSDGAGVGTSNGAGASPRVNVRHTMVLSADPLLGEHQQEVRVVIKNWLYKRTTGAFKTWKRRYFVLENHCLYYFKDETMAECLFCMPLPGGDVNGSVDKTKRDFTFAVTGAEGGRDLLLAAESENIKRNWLVALYPSCQRAMDDIDQAQLRAVSRKKNKGVTKTQTESGGWVVGDTDDNEDSTIVVTDDANNPVLILEGNMIEAATMDKLIERLCPVKAPSEAFVDMFIQTFRHVVTPEELIHKLIGRFNCVPPPDATDEQLEYVQQWASTVQGRVADLVGLWVDRAWFDFHDNIDMVQTVMTFLDLMREQDAILASKADAMDEVIRQRIEEYDAPLEATDVTLIANDFWSAQLTLLDLDPAILAKQLTALEFERFAKVRREEYLVQLWGDKSNDTLRKFSSNLTAMINAFNHTSYWVATEICLIPEASERWKMVAHFIVLGRHLYDMGNFNQTMAVLSGLNVAAVQRLKHTWAQVPKSLQQELRSLEARLSPESNYDSYRRIPKSPPCIPFFGLYLKDLTFLDDGNPKRLDNGLINVDKLRRIYAAIDELYAFSRTPYDIQSDRPLQKYLEGSLVLDEKTLFEYSLRCEPRGAIFIDGKPFVPIAN